ERSRLLDPPIVQRGSRETEQADREERVVLRVPPPTRAPVSPAAEETAVLAPQVLQYEAGGRPRGVHEPRLVQDPAAFPERRDGQTIPSRDDLVVGRRPHSLLAAVEQLSACGLHPVGQLP